MNKRSAKVLIGCIICTSIVFLLFLIVFKFAQLSCELVALDPIRLGSSQLVAFSRDSAKPIRSHDETILMRISAYLEYNIQPESSSEQTATRGSLAGAGRAGAPFWPPPEPADWLNRNQSQHLASGPGDSARNLTGAGRPALNWSTQASSGGGGAANQPAPTNATGTPEVGPSPALASMFPAGMQQAPHSFLQAQQPPAPPPARGERRFLPLELKSIETRNSQEGARHKYILNFNCTKINMVLVHQSNRVYVESMSLELRPSSRQETTCEVQLPQSGAFAVADSSGSGALQQQQQQPVFSDSLIDNLNGTNQIQSARGNLSVFAPAGGGNINTNTNTNTNNNNNNIINNNMPNTQLNAVKQQAINQPAKNHPTQLARYYCNRPLRYSCYHYNSKNGLSQSNGVLLAELHINGIEFETSTSWQGKHKKIKSEFKGKRSECNMA